MAVMEQLHLEIHWIAAAFGVFCISLGFSMANRNQRRVINALHKSEERFAFAVSGTNDGIWDWNIRTNEDYLSPRWKAILGYEDDELENVMETFTSLIHPADRNGVTKAVDAHLRDRLPYNEIFRLRHKEGHYIWVRARGEAIWDDQGEPVRMAGSISDISERKAAEELVSRAEGRLFDALDNLPVGFLLCNNERRVVYFNKALVDVWPHQKERLRIGAQYEDLIRANIRHNSPSRDANEIDELIAARFDIIEGLEVLEGERRLPGGKWFHSIDRKTPHGDYVSLRTDITERKQTETALGNSERRFRDFAETASDWLWETDAEGRFTVATEAFYEASGLRPEDLIGKTRREVNESFYRSVEAGGEEGQEDHLAAFDRKEEFRDELIEYPRADGTTLYFLTNGRPVYDEGGEFQGYRGTAVDITARRKADEDVRLALLEAEHANQAKTNFMAMMSHELRTPLAAIIGFSETMSEQYFGALGSQQYVEYAADIKASGEHLLLLINDLLDLSTIEAGKHQLHKESLNFHDIVTQCDLMVMGQAARKEITYFSEVTDGLPPITADQRALKQILLNIMTNAIKFTPKGGKISLKVTASEETLIVTIRDTGIGVPKEKLDDLTIPFVRGESDYRKAQEGAGLGLAIVKSLVELHDGELSIESEVGKGTTVSVSLPCDRS